MNTSTNADKAITEALIAKHNQALEEYERLHAELLVLYERSRLNFLNLRDLNAAGRVFGLDFEMPENNARRAAERFFLSPEGRAARAEMVDMRETLPVSDSKPSTPASAVEPSAMPRIRDIVLERLRVAGNAGTRALPIRQHIQEKYGRDIHEKTVGMTLYRLSREGMAHRVGITWFSGPDLSGTKNPGAATPGSKDVLL